MGKDKPAKVLPWPAAEKRTLLARLMAIGSPRTTVRWPVHPDFTNKCAFWLSRTQWVHFEREGDKSASEAFDLTTKTEEDVLRVADVWSAASVACLSAAPNTALDTPRQTEGAADSALIPATRLNTDTLTSALAQATAADADVTLSAAKHNPETPRALSPVNVDSLNTDHAATSDAKLDDAEDLAMTPRSEKRARKRKKPTVTVNLAGVPISSTNLRLLGLRLLQIQELRQRVLQWSHKSILRRLKCLTYVNESRNTPLWWSVQMELQLFCGSCARLCCW